MQAARYLLRYHGASISADGHFRLAALAATESFQPAHGLGADGQIGPQTWSALLVQVQEGSSDDDVRAAQMELNKFGFGTDSQGIVEVVDDPVLGQVMAGLLGRSHDTAPGELAALIDDGAHDLGLAGATVYLADVQRATVLESAYEIGGDAFDHALGRQSLSTVVDAHRRPLDGIVPVADQAPAPPGFPTGS